MSTDTPYFEFDKVQQKNPGEHIFKFGIYCYIYYNCVLLSLNLSKLSNGYAAGYRRESSNLRTVYY